MRRLSSAALFCTVALCCVLLAAQQLSPSAPCDPDNGGLVLPAGFCAAGAADTLGPARHMTVAPNGDLYVELHADNAPGGSVVALRDIDGDGRFYEQEHLG